MSSELGAPGGSERGRDISAFCFNWLPLVAIWKTDCRGRVGSGAWWETVAVAQEKPCWRGRRGQILDILKIEPA